MKTIGTPIFSWIYEKKKKNCRANQRENGCCMDISVTKEETGWQSFFGGTHCNER